ncbi:putative E3 ubiquitin-protein ligase LIN [Salvia hispanica]|uniref:putative E3 ubiquitin-protein ligase LIN n=1 Tax=Salvia hispanica TaxID=49212 RepID=UPI0020095004|nr:putative E3 ubiquitin-protein ligase LIN [Salvia hispanica]
MASSLHNLLSEDGFPPRKPPKKPNHIPDSAPITLPIYICHDRRSFDSSSSHRPRSDANSISDPAVDAAATKAMIAILTGYIAQFSRSTAFRANIRDKSTKILKKSAAAAAEDEESREALKLAEIGIESVERLADGNREKKLDLEALQRCIKILDRAAAASGRKTSSRVAACARLYLSITYKIARNDKIAARNLLQVFCDAPALARTRLLPELWEHFFLPHLLHLKIWYTTELENLAGLINGAEKEKRIKSLNHLYREKMDSGTVEFALYYTEWLKTGARAPSVPAVSLPSKPMSKSRRKSSESTSSYHSSSSKLLYQAVFGANVKRQSMDFDSRNVWDFVGEDVKHCNYIHKKAVSHRRSSSLKDEMQKAELLLPDTNKSDYFRFLGCKSEPAECFVSKIEKISVDDDVSDVPSRSSDVAGAIAAVCSSESLADCEAAVRALSKAWLAAQGDARLQLEASLSRAAVIQGMLEVLYVSDDDEILELAVSILAGLAALSEANRRCVLASDSQLSVGLRMLRSSSLFLKAAALLYLVRPRAKQMVSMEWVPLVLRVLEFGDQLQILFSVRCSPHEAAYYFLNELLTGFDEDRNFENAKQVISLGGLGLVARRMDEGDVSEKRRAASLLRLCIRADGSCRHFLVKNVKEAILALLVLEKNQENHALALLFELLCISRLNKRIEFLSGLREGWECLNTLHILLLRLHKARPEERPLVAVVLLELDLLGDASGGSVYRDEAVDAIISALDCSVFEERVQQQAARALLVLGGHFSYTGEEEIEQWLLRRAEIRDICVGLMKEDEKMREDWQGKAALALLTSGNTRLLTALSESIANSIPSLARACLVTICWISSHLPSIGDRDLRLAACSIFTPRLMECLIDNSNNLEEKILASFSLYSLTNGTDYFSQQPRTENEVMNCLQKLSRATWTAKELVSLIKNSSSSVRFLSV